MRRRALASAAFGALSVAGCALLPNSAFRAQLGTGAGVAAKQLCTLEFVSGLDRDRARELYVDPILQEGARVLRVEFDAEAQTVTARLTGLAEAHAVHRSGYGCTLVLDPEAEMQPPAEDRVRSPEMWLDPAHRDVAFDADALDAAVTFAFEQPPDSPPLDTLAVVVLHDGRLVAERYAEGITPHTRLPGWSMTKSVTATWAGVLAAQGRLDATAPGILSEWRDTSDPRAEITLDHLLRMSSGMLLTEAGDDSDGNDPTSLLLYHMPDAAGYAARQPLVHPVGTHFEYMSGSTVLATRAVQEAIGGGLREALEALRRDLFDPLGMHSAVFEPDQVGTFLGSTHMVATARDWARLGQLYVDGGMAGDRRLVTEEWIDYVTTPTPGSRAEQRGSVFWEPGRSSYGAGFWLFPDAPSAEAKTSPLPGDAFDANGYQGQYLHIIPSKKLVVVRLGATNFRGHDHERLPHDVLEALR